MISDGGWIYAFISGIPLTFLGFINLYISQYIARKDYQAEQRAINKTITKKFDIIIGLLVILGIIGVGIIYFLSKDKIPKPTA